MGRILHIGNGDQRSGQRSTGPNDQLLPTPGSVRPDRFAWIAGPDHDGPAVQLSYRLAGFSKGWVLVVWYCSSPFTSRTSPNST